MKILLQIIFLGFVYLLISCESNPVSSEAELMDLAVLSKTPGFQWFDLEIDKYQPDTALVNQIKTTYNPSVYSLVLYVKPSCSCPGTQQQFPAFIKTLREAGISETNYKVYSMNSEAAIHPFDSIFKVNELPTFILLKNNRPIYSIGDTFYIGQRTGKTYKLEQLLLNGLAK